jgi:hypothetical protein
MSCIYMHSHILHYSIGLRAHHFQSEYCRCASCIFVVPEKYVMHRYEFCFNLYIFYIFLNFVHPVGAHMCLWHERTPLFNSHFTYLYSMKFLYCFIFFPFSAWRYRAENVLGSLISNSKRVRLGWAASHASCVCYHEIVGYMGTKTLNK